MVRRSNDRPEVHYHRRRHSQHHPAFSRSRPAAPLVEEEDASPNATNDVEVSYARLKILQQKSSDRRRHSSQESDDRKLAEKASHHPLDYPNLQGNNHSRTKQATAPQSTLQSSSKNRVTTKRSLSYGSHTQNTVPKPTPLTRSTSVESPSRVTHNIPREKQVQMRIEDDRQRAARTVVQRKAHHTKQLLAAERFRNVSAPPRIRQEHQASEASSATEPAKHSRSRQKYEQEVQAARKRRDARSPSTPPTRRRRPRSQSPYSQHMGMSLSKTKEYARQMIEGPGEALVRGVVETGYNVGQNMTDCVAISSDMVQPTYYCGHRQGDNNSEFLLHHANSTFDYEDTTASRTNASRSRDAASDEDSDCESEGGVLWKPSSSSHTADNLLNPIEGNPTNALVDPPKLENKWRTSNSRAPEEPFHSSRGVRYPQAAPITPPQTEEPVRPREYQRRPRGSYEEIDDKLLHSTLNTNNSGNSTQFGDRTRTKPYVDIMQQQTPNVGVSTSEYADLRNVRIRLFQQDIECTLNKDTSSTAVKYTRALEELSTQDETVRQLQDDLKAARDALEQTKRELFQSRMNSARQRQVSTQSSTKVFRDRLDVEERLRHELKTNADLSERLINMESEMQRLKEELRESKADTFRRMSRSTSDTEERGDNEWRLPPSPARSRQQRESPSSDIDEDMENRNTKLSAEIVSLRAEVIELRAQLADARASRLTTEQQREEAAKEREKAKQEADDLKAHVSTLTTEIDSLRERNQIRAKESDEETSRLKEELDKVRMQMIASSSEATEKHDRSNRLEEQLAKTQNEASSLRDTVSEVLVEKDNVKRQAQEKIRVTDDEVKSLQAELRRMKEGLSRTHTEIISQAAEHLQEKQQLQAELEQTKIIAFKLQGRVAEMDEKIADAENEALKFQKELELGNAEKNTDVSVVNLRRSATEVLGRLRKNLDKQKHSAPSKKGSDAMS